MGLKLANKSGLENRLGDHRGVFSNGNGPRFKALQACRTGFPTKVGGVCGPLLFSTELN